MTSSPPLEEAPQFHTQTLSPISPRPLHFPEPSKIPVLQNQMDPDFNNTANHTSQSTTNAIPISNEIQQQEEGLPVDETGSSDTYAEPDNDVEAENSVMEGADREDTNDDYAMSLEFGDD